jgi:DinB superfamily
MTDRPSNESACIAAALHSWNTWTRRLSKVFDSLSDEEMLAEIAPGKNRPVYLLGHLIAIHDTMVPQLRLGEAAFPQYQEIFIKSADRAVEIPATSELRQNWKDVETRLAGLLKELPPAEWLERHATVSEEDFAKEPHRNRLAILLSRTSHASYHLGQLMLFTKV